MGYRVVTEEQLLKGGQAVQRATVHLCQAVVVQVTARDKKKKWRCYYPWDPDLVVCKQQDVRG